MKTPPLFAGFFALLATVPLHAADDFFWNTAGPADWNTPANWTSANVGTGSNFRFVNNGGVAQITTNPTLATSLLLVGEGPGRSGTVNHLAGTRSTTGEDGTVVGGNGGTGTYNLANTALAGGVYSGFARGSGSMTSTGFPRGQYRVGVEGGTGTLNINTTGSIALTHLLVGDNGVGTVNFDGGNFSAPNMIAIGTGPFGNGTWRMSGGSAIIRDLHVGASGATGSVTLNSGSMSATQGMILGFGGGGTGTLTITGGGMETGHLGVGYEGKGTVTQSGGIVNVNSGWFSIADYRPASAGSSYALTAGELNVKNNTAIDIGKDAAGSMSVSGTGRFTSNAFEAVLGRSPTGVGTLEISGNGNVTGLNMTLGKEGAGILNMSGNGVLDIGVIWLADTARASGTINGNGGTLITNGLWRIAGSALFNANGIKLTIRDSQPEFLLGFTSANIELQTGGLKVDSNGFNLGTACGLDGVGGLTKLGLGTLTLSGINTYTGATTVEAGTLAVTGSIAASSTILVKQTAILDISGAAGGFDLASGQTLTGKGTVVGNADLLAGSFLAPGESAGTLTFTGNLDLSLEVVAPATHALLFELGTIAASDRVLPTGTLNIGAGLEFDDFVFTALGGFGPGTYTLFDTSSAINGSLGAGGSGFIAGNPATLSISGNGQDVLVNVIPEPSAWLVLFSGAALLALRRRRG